VAEYAISTNLISWVPAKRNFFGWPQDDAEAEVIEGMGAGDYLIPKFAQNPDYRRHGSQAEYVKGICEALDLDYDMEREDYEATIKRGEGAVPAIWQVKRRLPDRTDMPTVPWSCVEIESEDLPYPLSTTEFLRLRAIPIELARQFKATASKGRHVQQVPDGTADAIRGYGQQEERPEAIRRLTLVKAGSPEQGVEALQAADRGPQRGDYAFLVDDDQMPGFYEAGASINLQPRGERILEAPVDLRDLFERAKERALPSDRFKPAHAIRAAVDLADFMAANERVREITEYAHFYDRFINLDSKVSQALELAARDALPQPTQAEPEDDEDESDDSEQVELDQLHGLTTSAVQAQLEGIVLPPSVLAEAVTALRSGKHLLLSGPPGTGKSTVAAALCRAVVSSEFDIATATADWTTFDTIGGYIPRDGSALEFEPGIVLRSLQRGRWLVIDELNRADIDKAFGPLFTLLASSGEADGAGESVVLPFKKDDRNIRIVWAETREDAQSPYALTPVWRLIGTLNVRDKATLFQLSFAFLRRFAVVEVPLPELEAYRALYSNWSSKLEGEVREQTVEAAMQLAFGRVELGPAILKDIANFTSMGLTKTETASAAAPYNDPVAAFLTAVRLYAVPQYEGKSKADTDDLLQRLRGVWPDPPEASWGALGEALDSVRLS
jgi:MoxR-like ATPase